MSDASRHALYEILEVTYGTTPDTPAWNTVRHTGTTLGLSKGTLMSEELRPDRQIVDYRHGAKQAGGEIAGEISYGTYDAFFEAVLLGTWAAQVTATATTFSAAAADDSFNDSGNGFVSGGFKVGDFITVSGFTGTVANNGTYIIVTVAAGKITVTKADGTVASNIVDDAAGEAVTIAGAGGVLKAGVTRRSRSVMRNFSDQTAGDLPFHVFKGVEFNTMAVSVTPEAITKVTFGILGKSQAPAAGTAPAGSTYVAANTNGVIDAFTGSLKENGSLIAVITEVSFNLDNGLAPRFVVGSDETILPSIQRSNLTGQCTAYFENATLMNKFINQTISSLDLILQDASGNKLRFRAPRIKYNGGQPDTQGQGPITLTMPFQALYDSTLGTNIVIERIAA